MAAPTSTTNITGFFIIGRGFNLTKESFSARLTIGGSNNGRDREPFWASGLRDPLPEPGGVIVVAIFLAPQPSSIHKEMLYNRTQRERREKRQRADDHGHAHQQTHKKRTMRWERAGRYRHQFFSAPGFPLQPAAGSSSGTGQQHSDADRCIEVRRGGVDAAERASIVPHGAGIGVQHFGQPVRSVVAEVCGSIAPAN